MPTPAPNSSVVGALSWLLPIAGVLLWVFVLPSTRAAVRGRVERMKRKQTQPVTDEQLPDQQPTPTQRRREDDPEILRFDHAVVVSKFPSTRLVDTTTAPSD